LWGDYRSPRVSEAAFRGTPDFSTWPAAKIGSPHWVRGSFQPCPLRARTTGT